MARLALIRRAFVATSVAAVGVGVGKLARLEAGREVGGQPRRRAVHAPAGVVHGGERLLAAVEQPQVERQLVACKGR